MCILKSLNAVLEYSLAHFIHENGGLVVMEAKNDVPFIIQRVFVVHATENALRGQHAHKECAQFLVCSYGSIEVEVDDGENKQIFLLDSPDKGLLIPPGIWAEQHYKDKISVLTVLCDRLYDENDYIRDYAEFTAYRKNNQ